MITKKVSMRSIGKSSFSGLVNYICDEQEKVSRVENVVISNCISDDLTWAVNEVQTIQKLNKKSEGDKTYHLIISFDENDELDSQTLRAIEKEVCEAIGYGEHQRISAVHFDTDNTHIHVAINKIHPTKLTIHDPYRDYHKRSQACKKIEKKYGLNVTNHDAKKTTSQNKSDDMENMAGVESLIGFIQKNIKDQILGQPNWQSLHQLLDQHGLTIQPKGKGLVFSNQDDLVVKASSIDRQCSKGALEKRLGKYEPANHIRTADKSLYQAYQDAFAATIEMRRAYVRKPKYIREKQPDEQAYHAAKKYFGEFRPGDIGAMERNTNNGKGVDVELPDGQIVHLNNQLALFEKVVEFNQKPGSFYDENYIKETSLDDYALLLSVNESLATARSEFIDGFTDKSVAYAELRKLEKEVRETTRSNNVDSPDEKDELTETRDQVIESYKNAFIAALKLRKEFSDKPGYIREKSPEEQAYHQVKKQFGEFIPRDKAAMERNTNGGKGADVKLPSGKTVHINNQLELYKKVVEFNQQRGSFYDESTIAKTSKKDFDRLSQVNADLESSKKLFLALFDDKKAGYRELAELEKSLRQRHGGEKEHYEPRPKQSNAELLWDEYSKKQKAAMAQSQDLSRLKDEHRHLINAARGAYRLEVLMANQGDGEVKRLALFLARNNLRNAINQANKKYRQAKRAAIKEKKQAWNVWLQAQSKQGSKEAIAILAENRPRAESGKAKGNAFSGAGKPTKAMKDVPMDTVTKQGRAIYKAGNKLGLRDVGNALRPHRSRFNDQAMRQALIVTMKRFGPVINVQGSKRFKHQAVRVAAENRLPVYFQDNALERQRKLTIRARGIDDVRRAEHYGKITGADQSDVRGVRSPGATPPAQRRNRLRSVSELGVVRIGNRPQVLLPRDVSHRMEHTGAQHDNPVRRHVPRPRRGRGITLAKPEALRPVTLPPVKSKPEATKLQKAISELIRPDELTGVDLYIAERNAKRAKHDDILLHQKWNMDQTGTFIFDGVRAKNNQVMVLLRRDSTVYVMPVDAKTAGRVKRSQLGSEVAVDQHGKIARINKGLKR